MFRERWYELEENLNLVATELRERILEKLSSSKEQIQGLNIEERKEKFKEWGKAMSKRLKKKHGFHIHNKTNLRQPS